MTGTHSALSTAAGHAGSLGDAALILAAAGVTVLPQSIDRWVTPAVTRLSQGVIGSRRERRLAAVMERHLGGALPGRPWRMVAREHLRTRVEGEWSRARAIHQRGWRAQLDIEGKEHLDAALEHGRGAVLWRMRFCSTHVAKQALAEVGVSMVHVGAARHGARFDNAIGRRIVAPLYRRAEDRHLARRILIAEDGSLEYLRELLEELRANQVISIFGAFPGRASVRRVVCGAELEFATGAPSLTRRSGAVLLTMYTHRLFRDSYRVVIQKPIEPTGGDRTAYLGGAVDEFARRLEDAIRRHPGSWYGWKALTSAA